MKKLLFIFALIWINISYSQVGNSCLNAQVLVPGSLCNYQTYSTDTSFIWFKFIATSSNVNISLITTKFGIDIPHIHNLSLYEGTCGDLILKTEDELPFEDEAKTLSIDLNASGLILGNEYYLKADREAHFGICDKATCRFNQSTLPSTFDLCVQDISIIIPLDFGLEPPSNDHAYEQNRGQVSDFNGNVLPQIKMFSTGSWPHVFIAEDFTSFVWSRIDTISATVDTVQRIDMKLVNGNNAKVFKTEDLQSYNNYYLPHIPKGVLKNKSFYRSVQKDVYPNIDLQFYSNENGVKFYFVLNEGSDPSQIKMKFEGANSTSINSGGSLVINSVFGDLKFKKAIVYRINPAGNVVPMPISGDYIQTGLNEYSVFVQNYSFNMPVIIQIERDLMPIPKADGDPTWSTYFGGNQNDLGYEIDSDDQGNIYVGGATNSTSTSFPITAGAQFTNLAGDYDGWLGMFDVNYVQLWTTFIGGDNYDAVSGIDHDDLNNAIYIGMGAQNSASGIQAQAFNSSPSSFASQFNTGAYISRFNEFGFREWGTWLPGHSFPPAYHTIKVKVDNEGSVVAVGTTSDVSTYTGNTPQAGFPIYSTSPNAYKQLNWGGGDPNLGDSFGDGFIAKFDNQTQLVWSTLFGGNRDEIMYNLAIDKGSGDIFIVGSTRSELTNPTQCPTTVNTPFFDGRFPLCQISGGYYQNSNAGPTSLSDGFIARFSKLGEMKWSTFYGGDGEDAVTGIDIFSGGSIVVSGFTTSSYYGDVSCGAPTNSGFPKCNNGGYYQSTSGGSVDAFIAKFRDNALLEWSTYVGGNLNESVEGVNGNDLATGPKIHVDDNLKIFMYGNTQSGSIYNFGLFPTYPNSSYYSKSLHADYNTLNNVRTDNYIMMFTGSTLQWSTYFGGTSTITDGELAGGITTYGDRVYICGTTYSPSTFPLNCPPMVTNPPYCDVNISYTSDAYIAQLVKEGVTNVGVEELEIEAYDDLNVYPNPSNGNITLEWQNSVAQDLNIEIFNQVGQIVYKSTFFAEEGTNLNTINISSFANGIYVISVGGGVNSFKSKIIKN